MQQDRNIILLVSDITMLKEVESYAQKERSRFFSSVAHELRTPLNSILPLANRIKETTFDTSIKGYAEVIINSSNHLSNVIEDALDLSRIENNKFQIFF